MQKFAFAFAAAALVAAAAGAAAAQDYRITIGDLDLGSARGAAAFDARVDQAADRACGRGTTLADITCRQRFREEAMRQLPSAHREDYARARNGRVLAMVPLIYG